MLISLSRCDRFWPACWSWDKKFSCFLHAWSKRSWFLPYVRIWLAVLFIWKIVIREPWRSRITIWVSRYHFWWEIFITFLIRVLPIWSRFEWRFFLFEFQSVIKIFSLKRWISICFCSRLTEFNPLSLKPLF